MVEVWIPYGTTEVPVRVGESLLDVIDAKGLPTDESGSKEVLRALNNPIGTKRLEEMVKPGDKIAIAVADDLSPNHLILPILVEKLNVSGIRDSDIILFLGHDPKADRVTSRVSDELVNRVNVVAPPINTNGFIRVGRTSRRTRVHIKDAFMEADLRILTGGVGFHPHLGYIGGRSGVFLPSICGPETIQHSHSYILDPKSRVGGLERNPINEEAEEIAHMVNVNFIINVVFNTNGEVVKAVAGDLDGAFLEGVKIVDTELRVSTEKTAGIVILSSGGDPWDVTLYRASMGLAAALKVVQTGGVMVWVAECPRGYGNSTFYDWMVNLKTIKEVEREVKRNFVIGGDMAYLLLKALRKVRIILVSMIPDYYATGIFGLRTARTVNAALKSAHRMVDRKSTVLILPHGNTVLPIVNK
jgi:nickel-dependent lactate racemase